MQFNYTVDGLLDSIVDSDLNITQITRSSGSAPTGLQAPFGHTTTLVQNGNGYLSSVADPQNNAHLMQYSAAGLLTRFDKPAGGFSVFTYAPDGRLERDEDSEGGFVQLTRVETQSSHSVSVVSAEGVVSDSTVGTLDDGSTEGTFTDAAGLLHIRAEQLDGTTTISRPDGTTVTVSRSADPRLGLAAPLPATRVVQTPGGLSQNTSFAREITTDPGSGDLLTVLDTETVNGRTSTADYDVTTGTLVVTDPRGSNDDVLSGLAAENYLYLGTWDRRAASGLRRCWSCRLSVSGNRGSRKAHNTDL